MTPMIRNKICSFSSILPMREFGNPVHIVVCSLVNLFFEFEQKLLLMLFIILYLLHPIAQLIFPFFSQYTHFILKIRNREFISIFVIVADPKKFLLMMFKEYFT